jgi:3-hydroxyisobutyrate dehydrogenase-like beta-hydroxyacid dehydrogenase
VHIGMIGLGNIGGQVATNLLADGHEVTVFDVDRARAEGVAGAHVAGTVAEVAAAAEVTILSLPTPAVVRAVAEEWVTAAPPGTVLVDLSTNSPAEVRSLGERLAATGHHLVEAPLTGGGPGAQHRMLVFMVGGDDEPVARVLPVLEPLGRATFHLGPLGLGNTMKLVNSLIAFTTTWVSLEGLSLAAKAGIPVQEAVGVLRTGGAGNFFIERMVEGIDQRGRPTMFALELAAKDAGLIVDTGAALGVPTPAGAAVRDVLARALEAGLGDRDWSELVAVAELAGDVELRWAP